MRDEDLAKLPKSIDQWEVRQFLERLGIKHTDVFEVRIGVRSALIRVYARDDKGQRYRSPEGGEAAQHTISLPFSGSWDRPAGVAPCTAVTDGKRCNQEYNHSGPHGRIHEGFTTSPV